MKRHAKTWTQVIITLVAAVVAIGHAIWPALRIDLVTLGLLVLAILPWLAPVIKSIEVPGVGKIELQEVKQEVLRVVRSELEPMEVKLTEPQTGEEALSPATVLNDDERKVLRAFSKRTFAYRTRTGLALDAGLDKADVNKIVERLKVRGLVGSKSITTTSGQKTRWYITDRGRETIPEERNG